MDKLELLKGITIAFCIGSIGCLAFSIYNIIKLIKSKHELNDRFKSFYIYKEELNERKHTLNMYILFFTVPTIAMFIITFYLINITFITVKLI